jgi:hypothetical protein
VATALREAAREPAPRSGAGRDRILQPVSALDRRTRAMLALLILALAIVPVLVTMARSSDRFSHFTVTTVPGADAPTTGLDHRVLSLLARPDVARPVFRAKEDRPSWALYEPRLDRVTVTRVGAGDRSVVVRVPGRSSAEAQDVAVVIARAIDSVAARVLRRAAEGRDRRARIDEELREPGLTPARRLALTAELRFIKGGNQVPLRVSAGPERAPLTGIDALVAKVERSGAPRPHPAWAGLAGLLLGLAVSWLWIMLPRRRS